MTARPLPYSLEAEESLLSICIQDGLPTLNKCMEARLTPGSFYDSKHGTVFARLLGMLADNKPIAIDTLAEDMKEARVLDHVGGYAFLAQVSSRMPTSAQAAYFIEKVADYARLRAVIRNGTELVEAAHNWTGDWDAVKAKAEGALEVFQASEAARSMSDIAAEAEKKLDIKLSGEFDASALRWPLDAMNRFMYPISAHEMVVIGARPSTGKTSLMTQIAGKAIEDKKRVLFFPLEVIEWATLHQIAGQRADLDLRNIGLAEKAKVDRFRAGLKYLASGDYLRVFAEDSHIDKIEGRCRVLKDTWKPDVVMIDYMGLISGARGSSTTERMTEISNRLMDLKKQMGCPLIVASQLNRGSEREDREPIKTDLRDSGAIEQDAHRIVFIWRPTNDFAGIKQVGAEVGQKAEYSTYFIQAKFRDGPISSIKTKFAATHAKFLPA